MEKKRAGRHDKIGINTIKVLPSVCSCQIEPVFRKAKAGAGGETGGRCFAAAGPGFSCGPAGAVQEAGPAWEGSLRQCQPCPLLGDLPSSRAANFPAVRAALEARWRASCPGGKGSPARREPNPDEAVGCLVPSEPAHCFPSLPSCVTTARELQFWGLGAMLVVWDGMPRAPSPAICLVPALRKNLRSVSLHRGDSLPAPL